METRRGDLDRGRGLGQLHGPFAASFGGGGDRLVNGGGGVPGGRCFSHGTALPLSCSRRVPGGVIATGTANARRTNVPRTKFHPRHYRIRRTGAASPK